MLSAVTPDYEPSSAPMLSAEQASDVLAYMAMTVTTEPLSEKAAVGQSLLLRWLSASLREQGKCR